VRVPIVPAAIRSIWRFPAAAWPAPPHRALGRLALERPRPIFAR
jgi:hypothetical protein